MNIQRSISIGQSPQRVYELLKRNDFFPKFIFGVELIKIAKKDENKIISEWWINFKGTNVKWKQVDRFDDSNLTVEFGLLEGNFLTYEGTWRVFGQDGRAHVSLSVSIDWDAGLKDKFRIPDLEQKTRLAVRWMLNSLWKNFDTRRIVNIENFLGEEVVLSELFFFTKKNGQKIVGYFDHMRKISVNAPFIIAVPGYGETKRDSLFIAYYLAKNGFNVIRYDATDHVGESDGDILGTTLEKNKLDILSIVEYIEKNFGVNSVGVVSSSMGARAALKAASENHNIVSLISVSGVVDVQATLYAVYYDDLIGNVLRGQTKEFYEVLGHTVNNDFFHCAINCGYQDLVSTKNDLEQINIPVTYIMGAKDVWVNSLDVEKIFNCDHNLLRKVIIIKDAMHQLFENPKASKEALRYIVINAAHSLKNINITKTDVVEPNIREIAIQNKVEKTRFRNLVKRTLDDEKLFWGKYIVDFTILQKFEDYNDLLNCLIKTLSPIEKGTRFLDAGCGVGYMSVWLMIYLMREAENSINEQSKIDLPLVNFECVDFIDSNLALAKANNQKIEAKIINDYGLKKSRFKFRYNLIDLNKRLPYEDGSFDYICSNLVISYLSNPLFSLRELFRVLKKDGKIAVSTLKPFADISQIYRNFINTNPSQEEIEGARKLLSSAGQIKKNEGEGHYYFYSFEELKYIFKKLGAFDIKTFRSFGNQANILVVSK